MIELYHFGPSTCSQKVRLVLAEKGLEFVSREVNLVAGEQHDPAYVKLNPKHVVPTLVHEGRVVVESSLILQYLDDAFPDPPLRPEDPFARYQVARWLRHVDDSLHPAAPTLTYALGPRKVILAQPREAREAHLAAIPDPAARAVRRSVIEHGIRAPEFAAAFGVFLDHLDAIESALADRSWLSGTRFGLADASLLPYVLRVEHLGLDPLVDASERPALAAWLARVKALPSYAPAIEAWTSPALLEGMRRQGTEAWPELEPLVARHREGG